MNRTEAIAEEIRRIGDKEHPGHDNPHTQRIRFLTLLRLRGINHWAPQYLERNELHRAA